MKNSTRRSAPKSFLVPQATRADLSALSQRDDKTPVFSSYQSAVSSQILFGFDNDGPGERLALDSSIEARERGSDRNANSST
jgi:hypothetical protein